MEDFPVKDYIISMHDSGDMRKRILISFGALSVITEYLPQIKVL